MDRIAITLALSAFCTAFSWPLSAEIMLQTPTRQIEQQAEALFRDLPEVIRVKDARAQCGADKGVNKVVAYCTTKNVINLRDRFPEPISWAHHLAHVYGHAVQVRHGVADIALREIRARRDDESKLRGWVTRQVECIAGYIFSQTGLEAVALEDLYAGEPLTDSHWGRNPLAVGPKVSIGLKARAEWFDIGLTQGLGACAPGEFSSDLLIKALR